jgi:hypothetical protein
LLAIRDAEVACSNHVAPILKAFQVNDLQGFFFVTRLGPHGCHPFCHPKGVSLGERGGRLTASRRKPRSSLAVGCVTFHAGHGRFSHDFGDEFILLTFLSEHKVSLVQEEDFVFVSLVSG